MKITISVLVSISFLLATSAWSANGAVTEPAVPAKGKLGFGFEPGLVQGKDFVPGQLIVGFKKGVSAQAIRGLAAAHRGRMVKEIAGQAALLEFASENEALAAVQRLLAEPGVSFVERNGFLSVPPQPQLPRDLKGQKKKGGGASRSDVGIASVSAGFATGLQYHLTVIRKTAALPALSTTPPTVAVIDTGVDYTHSDLEGKVILGLNAVADTMDPWDDNGHGTHVAGIIAARADNELYGEGVCPNCKVLAVKVLDASGSGSFFDVAQGMAYTITVRNSTTPVTRVVNMSLGGPASSLVATQVLAMKNAGMVLVAAAGNENTSTVPSFPGADPNTALRVMATTENDSRVWFSNFSPTTETTRYNIAAPGWNIYSTVPGEGFTRFSGTSMASPVVAGAAALVWGQPGLTSLTRDQLVSRLVNNGKLISKGFAVSTRRLDVRKAILATSETALVGQIVDPFTGTAHSPNTTADTASLWNGTTQEFSDPTNRSGMFEMTGLTTGARTIRARRAASGSTPAFPVANMRNVTIDSAAVTGPYTDAKPRARPAGYASITLDWWTTQPYFDTTGCIDACNGWDFDLYVRLPSGQYLGYGNGGDLTASPFAIWPRDSLADFVPAETIVIGPSAANGIYKVFVDNWPSAGSTQFNPSWTGSLASVQVYRADTLFQNYPTPRATCGSNEFWHVGNLTKTGTTYKWTSVNICTGAVP